MAAGASFGAGQGSGQAKLGFASVLHGFSAEDLGFNPGMVPAWITTQVPASTLKEQIASGSVVLELGSLIDGISDIGFRNTLSGAKRGLQIKLPQNEVFHALTGAPSGPPSAPLGGGLAAAKPAAPAPASNAFVIQPGAPAGQVSRVEPAAAPAFASVPAAAAPAFTPAPAAPVSAFAPTPAPATQSLFAASAPTPAPAAGGAATSPFGVKASPEANPNPFAKAAPEAPALPAAMASPFGAPPPAPAASVEMPAFSAFGSPPPGTALINPAPVPAPVQATSLAPAPASAPLQPLTGAFKPFAGGTSPFGAPQSAAPPSPPTSSLGVVHKPFDPFASSSSPTGALRSTPPATESGFSSAQLLGQGAFGPAASQLPAFSTPPVLPETKQPTASLLSAFGTPPAAVPAAVSAFSSPAFAPVPEQRPSSTPSVPLFSEPARPAAGESKPAPAPAATPTGGLMAKAGGAARHSFLGLAPLDTQTDQLLLRALLGTEENLTAPKVVELVASLPGLSACVCLHGTQVLSHANKAKPDAAEFQRQAPDISRQLRGLAPLIGIDGAETFTLNAGGRLLTFCFPGSTTVGVLHEVEPTNGLRDKITLIARELARMLG